MAPLQRRLGRGSQDPRCGGHWAASLIHSDTSSRPSDRWVAAFVGISPRLASVWWQININEGDKKVYINSADTFNFGGI